MKNLTLLILLCSAIVLQAQQNKDLQIDIPNGPKPWTSLDLNNDEKNFQFAIVSDRTGGHRPGVFMEGVHRLNLLQPEFVMSVGDLIEGYTEDLVELNRQWDEFDGFVEQLEMPFFYVPGNHDITNQVMEDLWKKRLGPTHYYFIYRDVLFLCLNSEDQRRGASRGSISDAQYDWVKKVLEEHKEVKWTLLFMHQPLWVQETDPVRWAEVETLLNNRKHTVYVGHRHHYAKFERNNGKYFQLATTGGGSSLRGNQMGEFDHVVWVTMTDDGPLMANLRLDGISDENVTLAKNRNLFVELWSKNILQVEPLYIKPGKKLKPTTSRIKITNDQDVPLQVKLQKGFSWHLKASLSENKLEVAPNSVAFVDLMLESRKNRTATQYDPINIKANLSYEFPDYPKFDFHQQLNLAPEPKYILASTKEEIIIDGKLDEWAALPYSITTDKPTDAAAQFNFTYQDEYLYIAAKVTDDNVFYDPTASYWQSDFIGFVVNADPLEKSAADKGSGRYRNSVYYLVNPKDSDTPNVAKKDGRLPKGTKWICTPNETGYTLEVAIPMQYIIDKQGASWKTIRVNMVLQDRDEGETESPRYFFLPEWSAEENRIGSGMLFRK